MKKIELGDSLLGFIPNFAERRKVTDQRLASTLEKTFNYSSWYQTNEEKRNAVYSRKEHIVRLLFTQDYVSEDDNLFSTSQRDFSLKTGELLSKPKEEYWIKGHGVGKTEYEFGKYLTSKFNSLDELAKYAADENDQIKTVTAEKTTRLQHENAKREEFETARKAERVAQFNQAVLEGEAFIRQHSAIKAQAIEFVATYAQEITSHLLGGDVEKIAQKYILDNRDVQYALSSEARFENAAVQQFHYVSWKISPQKDGSLSNYAQNNTIPFLQNQFLNYLANFDVTNPRQRGLEKKARTAYQEIASGERDKTEPKQANVLYHGSAENFDTFELQDIPTNGTALGYGIYLTDNKLFAQRFAPEDGIIYTVDSSVLDGREAKDNALTLSVKEVVQIIEKISKEELVQDGYPYFISESGKEPHESWDAYNVELATEMAQNILQYENNDLDVVNSIFQIMGHDTKGAERLNRALESLNITYSSRTLADDGEVKKATEYVVFNPENLHIVSKTVKMPQQTKHKLDLVEIIYSQGEIPILGSNTISGQLWKAAYRLNLEKAGHLEELERDEDSKLYYDFAPHRLIDQMKDKGLNHDEAIEQYQEWLEENGFDFDKFAHYSIPQFQKDIREVNGDLKASQISTTDGIKVTELDEKEGNHMINKELGNTHEIAQQVTEENGKPSGKIELPKDPVELSQAALDLVKNWSKNPEEIAEYLEFMSKFPELSPRNVALIHEQWRGANAVATFDQWNGKTKDIKKNMPKVLGIKPEDVDTVTRTITDKQTGETKTFKLDQLSVRAGERSQISLLRPIEERYFEKERSGKIQAHFEKYWSAEEKQKVASGEIKTKMHVGFASYKVFEISQTNLKSESLPKALPNRHINFEHDSKLAKTIEEGLEIYAQSLEVPVPIEKTQAGHENPLGNAHGAFYPSENKILMNHLNTESENVTTLIHELTHATLHQNSGASYGNEEYAKQELEAELTAYVVSSHYGIDTKEKSIPYIAKWTKNAEVFEDKELSQSLSKVQNTAKNMIKTIDANLDPELKKAKKITQQNTQQVPQHRTQGQIQQKTPSIGR